MNRFTVRVELYEADSNDYDVLHKEMLKRKFYRTIVLNGIEYKLPDAEYNKVGNFNSKEILALTISAAEIVGKKFSVMITQSAGRRFHNLEPSNNPFVFGKS